MNGESNFYGLVDSTPEHTESAPGNDFSNGMQGY